MRSRDEYETRFSSGATKRANNVAEKLQSTFAHHCGYRSAFLAIDRAFARSYYFIN